MGGWLRPVLAPGEYGAGIAGGAAFERAGYVVRPDRRLGQVVRGRPPGITAHQWTSAARTRLDFVVGDAGSRAPAFAVEFADPAGRGPDAERAERMRNAVCDAVGLELLCIESATLRPAAHGRRIVEYLIDARAFADSAADPESPAGPDGEPAVALGYRDIVGPLPDGRTGFVNDLGAVARAAAVDAYIRRQLVDPIIRGLHARWKNGPAEGWGWVDVRDGWCVFERTRIWSHRFTCGVDPGRLAEDLSAAAIGERLRTLESAGAELRDRRGLGHDLDHLRRRRDEMDDGFGFDHVSFD